MKLLTSFLQITTSMAVFYLFYYLFLRRLTFFRLNRFYLLATLIISISIPFIQIEIVNNVASQTSLPIKSNALFSGQALDKNLEEIDNGFISDARKGPVQTKTDWSVNLFWVYVCISLALLSRLLILVGLLFYKTLNAGRYEGLRVIKSFWKFSNCSFFNLLIIDFDSLDTKEIQLVIQHEKEHVRRFHSFDKLLIELAKVAMWFNPFVHLYGNAINQVQEFEVDEAMGRSFNKHVYSMLLLKLSVSPAQHLVNSFSKNPLKTRVQMLFTNQSNNMKKFAYVFMLPMAAYIVWLFSVNVVYAAPKNGTLHKKPPIYKTIPAQEPGLGKKTMNLIVQKVGQLEEADIAIDNEIRKIDLLPTVSLINQIEATSLKDAKLPEESASGKFRVVLDPGHGGKDNQARQGGVLEKNVTLAMCKEIKRVLEQKGYEVVLTRDADVTVSLADRAAVKGDVFISVHTNTWVKVGADRQEKASGNGIDIYTSKYIKADSLLAPARNVLAESFKKELEDLKGIRFNAIRNQYLAVLRENTAPAIVVELGYLTSKSDYDFIRSKDNQQQIGFAFANAIEAYRTRK